MDLAKDWNSVEVLEAIKIGIERIKANRLREINDKKIESSVTVSQYANNRIVCDALTTSELYSGTETALSEDLFEMQKALRDLGLPDLRGAFAIDRQGNPVVMVFLPRK